MKNEIVITENKTLISAEEQILSKITEDISNLVTPKHQIKKRPDGFDYIEEKFMRHLLNKHFPVWSWIDGKFETLGAEWILSSGTLVVKIGEFTKRFWSTGAARIQYKAGKPHTAENIVDIDKNVASANTNAFKRAINRLCNIGDDVYRKQVESFLSKEQHDIIMDFAEKLDEVEKFSNLIENGEINSVNYELSLKRLSKKVGVEL